MSASIASIISHTPISESRQILHSRTFALTHRRSDFRDVITQIVILMSQLHDEKFTGKIAYNFAEGAISSVTTTDAHSLTRKKEHAKNNP